MIDIKRDLAVLKWMVGTLYPLVIAILLKLFIPSFASPKDVA